MPNQQDKKPFMPAMTPIEFNILVSLVQTERHGTGIIQDVSERTGNELFLPAATLYTALKRMYKADWIQESDDAPPAKDGNAERRRYYRLSKQGLEALIAEVDRMERVAKDTRLILEDTHLLSLEGTPSPKGKKQKSEQTNQPAQKKSGKVGKMMSQDVV